VPVLPAVSTPDTPKRATAPRPTRKLRVMRAKHRKAKPTQKIPETPAPKPFENEVPIMEPKPTDSINDGFPNDSDSNVS
jgi:hypothetical protein